MKENWQPPARWRWTEDDGRAMAGAFTESGLSAAEVAQRHGVQVARVWGWRARVKEAESGAVSEVAFAPVRVVERKAERCGTIEIIVGRHRLRVTEGFCTQTLRQVLDVLGESAC